MEENGSIYARLVNNLYETICQATGNVSNIDKVAPNEAEIVFSSNTVTIGENVTATIKQSDGLSGIDIENCKYTFTTDNSSIGIDDESKYTETFENGSEGSLTLNCAKAGTYYLHILSVDFAGNKLETISSHGIKSTLEMHLIQNGNMGEKTPTLAHTNVTFGGTEGYFNTLSQPGTGAAKNNWLFRLYWANGFGSLSSVYWTIPALSEKATVEATYFARNDEAGVYADVYLFGAGVAPTGEPCWNAKPYSQIYGDSTIIQYTGDHNWTNYYTTTISLDNIKEPLYIGFAPMGPSRGAGDSIDIYVKSFKVIF